MTAARGDRDGRTVLTATEARIASLAAEGHTSKAIAHALSKNLRTTESHLQHAYVKLGLSASWGNPRVRLGLTLAAAGLIGCDGRNARG